MTPSDLRKALVPWRAWSAPSKRSFGVLVRTVLVLVTALAAGIFTGLATRDGLGDNDLAAIQIVISPHPDDELQGWAKLVDDDQVFTVFVLMSRGEATSHCNGAKGLDRRWGERPPSPLPSQGDRGTERCASARLDSWHAFLDAATATLPGGSATDGLRYLGDLRLGPVPGVQPPTTVDDRRGRVRVDSARIWVGDRTARIALDAGDGDVMASEVQWAVRAVVAEVGKSLPDLPIRRLVSAAYANDSPVRGANTTAAGCRPIRCDGDPRDYEYEHPDHVAVTAAVAALAHLAAEGAWLATHPHDPRATDRVPLTPRLYNALMGLGPRRGPQRDSFERTGAQQVAYGWLSFPRSYWPRGRTASAEDEVLFPRVQFFRHVRPGDPEAQGLR
jgi:hypothetical protein